MVKRVGKGKHRVFCFPDTNFFLHFTYFPEIDWPALVGSDHVYLVLTAPVLRELDKHKNDPKSERRRDRSRKVLRDVDTLSESWTPGTSIPLRQATEILLDLSAPDMTQHAGRLDPSLEDDKILAHILTFKSDRPEGEVLLLSDDRGMRLKARALDIVCRPPPEELRLQDEPTTTERELARLEGEVASLRDRVPILDLQFKTSRGRSFELVFRYRADHMPSNDQVIAMVEKRRNELIAKSRTRGLGLYKFPHEEQEIESYLPRYRDFLIAKARYLSFAARLTEATFVLLNTGLVPAEDVVVEVEFPSGFHVFTEDDFPEQPWEPAPQIGTSRIPLWPEGRFIEHKIGPTPTPDSGWEVNQSRHASYTLPKVIHNVPEDLDPIVVRVPVSTQPTSFQIPYVVHAGNLPRPAAGELTLHVEPEAPDGD